MYSLFRSSSSNLTLSGKLYRNTDNGHSEQLICLNCDCQKYLSL